jgi:pyruvate formate lyase activating enzyme
MTCSWCHNIETIDLAPRVVWYATKCIGDEACVRACPENALKLTENGMVIDHSRCKVCGTCEEECPTSAIQIMGKIWSIQNLVEELSKDKVFFNTSKGGVTISGGEPTYQIEFMTVLAEGLREKGIQVILDTCGYCSEDNFRRAIKSVDMVLFDLKQMDPKKHQEYTGVPLDRVLANAKVLGSTGIPVWIRTPIIPDYTDDVENIRSISEFIMEYMPNVERFDLLAFNKMCIEKYRLFDLEYPLKDAELIQRETMERLVEVAKEAGILRVEWSGMTRREEAENLQQRAEVNDCGS